MSAAFEKKVNRPTNLYTMGTNFNGWGYPLSQTLSFSSGLPGIEVDVNLTPGLATAVFAGIRGDLPFFSLARVLLVEDDGGTGPDSSKVGLGLYIGGKSVIIEGVEIRL